MCSREKRSYPKYQQTIETKNVIYSIYNYDDYVLTNTRLIVENLTVFQGKWKKIKNSFWLIQFSKVFQENEFFLSSKLLCKL